MLKSHESIYEKRQLKWLSDAQKIEKARIVITIIEEIPIQNHRRQPPPELKGSAAWKGDPQLKEALIF
ncbi:MAG TPA: hypothetical protein P5552_10730 [Candidatus Competibacteraceae bacterium]|nr:hypothetical protein [Candidatus Competibacteraceae bacterium]